MSIGVLLAQNNIVTLFDIDKSKIDKVNKKISPIDDTHIKSFLNEKDINITGTNYLKIKHISRQILLL